MRYGVGTIYDPLLQGTAYADYFAAVKDLGRDFAVMPLGRTGLTNNRSGVTSAAVTAAAAGGVDLCFLWQKTGIPKRALGGYAAGKDDANGATGYLASAGVDPAVAPVYYALTWDYETEPGGRAKVCQYFQGIRDRYTALGYPLTKIGVLGGWYEIDWLISRALVTYACQHKAWQFHRGWHHSARIRQTNTAPWYVEGVDSDHYQATVTDFGQYRKGASPEAPPSRPAQSASLPATTPLLSATRPVGLDIPWGRLDTTLVMLVKDEDGNWEEHQGIVSERSGGTVPSVEVVDESADWTGVGCQWTFSNATIGEIVRAVIGDPTGQCPTHIQCHVEEPHTNAGKPIKLSFYSGQGRSLRSVLDQLCEWTGCTWCLWSRHGELHFSFFSAANAPAWDQLRDDTDGDVPGTSRRVIADMGEIGINQTRDELANRVYYTHGIAPPSPYPAKTWDALWCEDLSRWSAYSPCEVYGEAPPKQGKAAIRFIYEFTKTASNKLPAYVDLGYLAIQGNLQDMTSWYWGRLEAWTRAVVTTNQGITAALMPKSIVNVQAILRSGAYPGPREVTPSNNLYRVKPQQKTGTAWSLTKWDIYGKVPETVDDEKSQDRLFELANVHYVQFRAVLSDPAKVTALTTGNTWTLQVLIDGLHPVGAKAEKDHPTTSQHYVDAPEVADGEAQPIAVTMDDTALPYMDTEDLAQLYLEERNRMRTTFPALTITGIPDIPIRSRFPLELPSVGVTGASLGPVSITRYPFDNKTEIVVGDAPRDQDRAEAALRRVLERTRAQS